MGLRTPLSAWWHRPQSPWSRTCRLWLNEEASPPRAVLGEKWGDRGTLNHRSKTRTENTHML